MSANAMTLEHAREIEKTKAGVTTLYGERAALWRYHAATKRNEKPLETVTIHLGGKAQDFNFPTFEDVCERFNVKDFNIEQGDARLPTLEEQAAKAKSWGIPFDEQKLKETTFEYFCISHADLTIY